MVPPQTPQDHTAGTAAEQLQRVISKSAASSVSHRLPGFFVCFAKPKLSARSRFTVEFIQTEGGVEARQVDIRKKKEKKKTCWCWTTDSAGLSLILMLVTHHEIFLISLLRLSAAVNLLS